MKDRAIPFLAPFHDPDGIAQLICHTLQELTSDVLSPEVIARGDCAGPGQKELLQHLNSPQTGLHLALLPTQYGGLGLTLQQKLKVAWKMATIDLSLATAYMASLLALGPIIMGGDEEQKEYWLSKVAADGLTGALAATEPESGSNLGAITTRAEPCTNGEGEPGYLLNGAKQFISNGSIGDFYLILANAPQGPSLFAAWAHTPGIGFGVPENKLGIRASTTTGVFFNQVFVPKSSLVGGEGKGLDLIQDVFAQSRLLTGAMALGAAEQAMGVALKFAVSRNTGHTPLLKKQGYVNKLFVESAVELTACQAYLISTASRFPDLPRASRWNEAAGVKLLCSESGFRVINRSLQGMGGYGYMADYRVEKIFRDARILTIYEGTSEVLQNMVAVGGLRGLSKSACPSHLGQEAGHMIKQLATRGDTIPREVHAGVRWAVEAFKMLQESLEGIMANRLIKHQHLLFAVADTMTVTQATGALWNLILNKHTPPDQPDPWQGQGTPLCAKIYSRKAFLQASQTRAMVLGLAKTQIRATTCPDDSLPTTWENLWDGWLTDYDMIAGEIIDHYREPW